MNAGDIYKTPGKQDRLILGRTSDGSIGYATRGGDALNAWHDPAIKAADEFAAQGELIRSLSPEWLDQARAKLGAWMESQGVA